jgi:hypothetical protein
MIMKKVFLAIIGIAIFTVSFAQKRLDEKKFHFSVGAELGFATGGFNNSHSVGIGGSAQAEYNVAPNTNVTLTAGVIGYAGKKAQISNLKYSASNIVPVKGGIKYFVNSGFYGAAQLGVAFFNNYVDVNSTPPYYGNYYGSEQALAFTPMIGYEFKSKSDKAFDASFKYDFYARQGGSFGSVGFRLAYKFR